MDSPSIRRMNRLFVRRGDINEDIIPFYTMKYLSDKQEETTDKNEFHEKYGFLFRDYELMSNIIKKHDEEDETYISDIKSSIIALKNSQNQYIKEVYSNIDEDDYDNEFLEKVLNILCHDWNFFNLALRNKYYESKIRSIHFPMLLSKLIAKLATVNHEVTNVYDPSCNEGMIITSLKEFNKAVLYEKDETTYTQAIQNFIINDISMDKINISQKDVLIDDDKTRYDTILSIAYPLRRQIKANNSINPELDQYRTKNPNSLQLLNLINHLEEEGLLITTITQDILVRKDALALRKYLMENNWLDAVIEYRMGIRDEVLLLIINKNKKTDDVLFIKQGEEFNIKRKRIQEQIIDCYKNREKIKHFSNIVSKEEITNNEYKIIPKRYVYTLNYETRNISDVKIEQEKYTEEIRKLDEEISQLLEKLDE